MYLLLRENRVMLWTCPNGRKTMLFERWRKLRLLNISMADSWTDAASWIKSEKSSRREKIMMVINNYSVNCNLPPCTHKQSYTPCWHVMRRRKKIRKRWNISQLCQWVWTHTHTHTHTHIFSLCVGIRFVRFWLNYCDPDLAFVVRGTSKAITNKLGFAHCSSPCSRGFAQ